MNNNRKRHSHIDNEASTHQVFTLLDAVQSDNEDEIEELMNDFDREFIAREEIKLTGNPSNVSALTLMFHNLTLSLPQVTGDPRDLGQSCDTTIVSFVLRLFSLS